MLYSGRGWGEFFLGGGGKKFAEFGQGCIKLHLTGGGHWGKKTRPLGEKFDPWGKKFDPLHFFAFFEKL